MDEHREVKRRRLLVATRKNVEVNGDGEATIPDGVTTIGSYAFTDCRGLRSVVIPGSVTEIGKYAFDECTGLKWIVNLSCVQLSDIFNGGADDRTYAQRRLLVGEAVRKYGLSEKKTKVSAKVVVGLMYMVRVCGVPQELLEMTMERLEVDGAWLYTM